MQDVIATWCQYRSQLPVSKEELWEWYSKAEAVERLLPPWWHVFLQPPGPPHLPDGLLGLKIRWGLCIFHLLLRYQKVLPFQEFTQIQVRGPFHSYQHRHCFQSVSANTSSEILDEVCYSIPYFSCRIHKELIRLFAWQHAIVKGDLLLKKRYSTTPMRILLSGSSGLIGKELSLFLRLLGHEVVPLVRNTSDLPSSGVTWNPQHHLYQQQAFEGFDAVIHLAGENIAKKRWSEKQKQILLQSRCNDTSFLAQILSTLQSPPKTVICASAIGYYGDRNDELLTEESTKGEGFLSNLCATWENSLHTLKEKPIRIVHARFGVVLSSKGGMLKQLLPIFKWGLGGKLGSGEQIMSWIGIDDVLGALYHILNTPSLEGPVNCVAPEPVSQQEMAEHLARHLHRRALMTVPQWALRLALGEMANEMLLSSTRVFPQKLLSSGYFFRYPNLKTALEYVVG